MFPAKTFVGYQEFGGQGITRWPFTPARMLDPLKDLMPGDQLESSIPGKGYLTWTGTEWLHVLGEVVYVD
jgi:hypothetical protein